MSHDAHFNIIARNKINQMIMCCSSKGMQFGNTAISWSIYVPKCKHKENEDAIFI